MNRRTPNAPDAVAPMRRCAQAAEVSGAARWRFVSFRIPVAPDGSPPEGFAARARQAMATVEAQPRAGGMGFETLVKVTILLADRADALASRRVREKVLGGRPVARTAVLPALFGAAWRIEIEAVAAA